LRALVAADVRLTKKEELIDTEKSITESSFVHVVTLDCKSEEHATQCIQALASYGRPDALAFNCISYEFGLKEGTTDTVYIIERWRKWQDLDALLSEKVVPALPMYNQLLKRPFDPAKDTVRLKISNA
jgi:quinol monooxygenase YgiN